MKTLLAASWDTTITDNPISTSEAAIISERITTLGNKKTALKEIRKYEQEIINRAGFTKAEFEILFNLITDGIQIVEKEKYFHKIKEADKLIGNIDQGDVPFLALALSIPNDGIWTENVKHFKQKHVKIWTTKELAQSSSE